MSYTPRLLVIDDDYGWSGDERNRNREHFCQRVGLQDVTGDVRARSLDRPVAEAVFLQGQQEESGRIENDLKGTIRRVRQAWQERSRPALLLLDLHFKTGRVGPDGRPRGSNQDRDPHQYFGLKILEQLWADATLREIPVVLLSSMDREAIEEQFAEHGVFDFIDKSDLDRRELRNLITTHGLIPDDRETRPLIGRSLPLLKALREARQRAQRGDDNVLILGESGTGKELLARYLHDKSSEDDRQERPLVTFYPQQTTDSLIESELFGHAKGAFTGADEAKPGAAERADGGTLFIDEFGDIPSSLQGKLLRLLDTNMRETKRQGSDETKQVDLQVAMATNNLDILNDEGFRSDLLTRAKARNPITLPPLRDRKEDIPLLAEHFVRMYEEEYGADEREITDDAMEAMMDYSWPGNVRELEDVIEEAVSRYRGLRSLSTAHLNLEGRASQEQQLDPGANGTDPSLASPTVPATEAPPKSSRQLGLNELIEQLREENPFREARSSELEGTLPALQEAYARLLDAALEATRKPLSGDLKYTPAVQLIMGSDELDSNDAKRLISNRLLKIDPDTVQALLPELQALRELFDEKPKIRPKELGPVSEE
jgi:DNA-binding NtrC family response regulator